MIGEPTWAMITELRGRVAELTRERDAAFERQRTPRGFDVYDEIETDYGHTIRVQESSSAEKSAVWLFVSDSPMTDKHSPHLTREQARRVRDALSAFLMDTEGSDDE